MAHTKKFFLDLGLTDAKADDAVKAELDHEAKVANEAALAVQNRNHELALRSAPRTESTVRRVETMNLNSGWLSTPTERNVAMLGTAAIVVVAIIAVAGGYNQSK